MSKEIKKTAVPNLRFPDFQKSADWQVEKIGNLVDLQSGYAFQSEFFSDKGEKLITPKNFTKNGYALFSTESTKYTTEDCDHKYICKEGDLLLLLTDLTPTCELLGKPLLVRKEDGKLLLNQRIVRVDPKPSLDPRFLLNFFLTNYYNKRVRNTATGSTVRHSSNKIISDTNICYPKDKKEQQKIADCLSSLDDLISAQDEKVEVLKKYKKGLLQQIFPQNGKTVPQLRFSGFKNSGNWITLTLTEVASYENGKAHEQDISDDGKYIVANSKFISTDGKVKKFTNTPFCRAVKDDILMVLSDVPNGRAIAKCYFVEENDKITVNQRICKIGATKANSKLLFYILNRNPYFLRFDDGVKQTNLSKDDVLNCPICLPIDPEEQNKIASILSTTDELIETQIDLLEELKLHKKGLLQQLFPLIAEGNDE